MYIFFLLIIIFNLFIIKLQLNNKLYKNLYFYINY